MSNENFILRTIYIDPDLDDRLTLEAQTKHTDKAGLFRMYLRTGRMVAHAQGGELRISLPSAILVLRTPYFEPDMVDHLRRVAFDSGIKQNDLIRHYLRTGMNV